MRDTPKPCLVTLTVVIAVLVTALTAGAPSSARDSGPGLDWDWPNIEKRDHPPGVPAVVGAWPATAG